MLVEEGLTCLQTLAQSDGANLQLIFIMRAPTKTKYKQCQNMTKQCFINESYIYLTIIPRGRVGYEMIDSQRGA